MSSSHASSSKSNAASPCPQQRLLVFKTLGAETWIQVDFSVNHQAVSLVVQASGISVLHPTLGQKPLSEGVSGMQALKLLVRTPDKWRRQEKEEASMEAPAMVLLEPLVPDECYRQWAKV